LGNRGRGLSLPTNPVPDLVHVTTVGMSDLTVSQPSLYQTYPVAHSSTSTPTLAYNNTESVSDFVPNQASQSLFYPERPAFQRGAWLGAKGHFLLFWVLITSLLFPHNPSPIPSPAGRGTFIYFFLFFLIFLSLLFYPRGTERHVKLLGKQGAKNFY
jgi:hypothetical protein